MRNCTIAIAIAATWSLAVPAAGADDKKPTDEEITQKLVGKWEVEDTVENTKIKIKGTTTYKKDGTLEAAANFDLGDQKIDIKVSGTWKVKDGIVTETVTKSSRPEIVKEGTSTRDTVISIDDKAYKFKAGPGKDGKEGKQMVARRVKE
jgi:hypothetical protein